jgi:hypothetical protein
MLERVLDILHWPADGAAACRLQGDRLERLAGAFGTALARAKVRHPDQVARLSHAMDAAAPAQLAAFLAEPTSFAALASGVSGEATLLAAAELHFSGQAADNAWLLLDGPVAFGPDIPVCGQHPFSAEEGAEQRHRVLEADGLLRRISPAAWDVVHRFAPIVVLRRDAARDEFLSSSSPRLPGRSVLINPQHAGLAELAEALLHEAIHAVLNAEQLVRPFVLDHAGLAAQPLRSPWSGNTIAADALLEACFVWFGLVRFWRCYTVDGDALLRRAAGGFLRGDPAALLSPYDASLARDVLPTIRSMQADIKAIAPALR